MAMTMQPLRRVLEGAQPLYTLPKDPFIDEVLIPGFQAADKVDCMVGFFSSKVLASLAPGLATYIENSENSFRLLISPMLSAEDSVAIADGMKTAEEVAGRILEELTVTENLLQRHTLKCLTWLLREGRIEIKVALMKDALFHPKIWLFKNGGDVVAAHGSSNGTEAAIRRNYEQVAIARSWQDSNQRFCTDKFGQEFGNLWENRHDSCTVIAIPQAVRQHLLRTYSSDTPPTEDDLRVELEDLYGRATTLAEGSGSYEPISIPVVKFEIPDGLQYEDGPFEHQGKAVTEWCEAGYQGILAMATGSGKTIAAMIGAHRCYEEHKPLLIVIAVPYVPLIEQWCDEIELFGLKPVNLSAAGGVTKRTVELEQLKRKFDAKLLDVGAVVVSHDTICSQNFFSSIEKFNCTKLLIADEVHNLGRESFIKNPPGFFEHRLGLSATPRRQYDEEGTEALRKFFGDEVFRFSLEEAIGRGCLVDYDYYLHPVELTESEEDEWHVLTKKIQKSAWHQKDGESNDYLMKLLRDRRALLETASGKIFKLMTLLDEEDTSNLRHTLIYTSDKGPRQLNDVNQLLRDRSIPFHQLTAKETDSRKKIKSILGSFQRGEIHVLTAKRVLDEGVNIPQICKAFILASTTVERQWVQRRGRLLRNCSAIGKSHSVIHDLMAVPPNMGEQLDSDGREIIRSELKRVEEFARLARNTGRPDGALAKIKQMLDVAYL